ncbi:efflux RND transporter periplasmic adaptor subunit [Syntrophobacter fumaroxidans]|uniref:Efflux transporter, RND family, MFP subunit n=1 Tax=Syntrophobacter fumaroxidans (strain DSM 10017 / MPOB) TaxID=335543 RepID=A0LL14_SYNFM|nr:efflux RND transporter periplasmic adaptor subunit [Syntrophobacter fumaroxidans]ABK18116.1 efflux transporter, RND family, MFP subunit [Syntrophobacter fumaroxidans MPOB]
MKPLNNKEPGERLSQPGTTRTGKKRGRRVLILLLVIGAFAGGFYTARNPAIVGEIEKLAGSKGEAESKDVYYCPMHPQIRSDKPGTCPICNMNLEKMEKAPEAGEQAAKEQTSAKGKPLEQRKILYWTDAMNPSFRSDKPGKAPDGMDLVPVYEEEDRPGAGLPPGVLKISPQKQQLIGVGYSRVIKDSLSKTIHAVARLAYDETKISRIQARVDGWIDRVFVDFTGKLVKKGQPLISIYSPELVSTQMELLLARKSKETFAGSVFDEAASGANVLYESTRERFRLWNIPDAQVREIEKRGKPSTSMTLSSPAGGFVVNRNAYPGQRITPETEIYSIVDLSTIWALAEVYEYEVPLIKLGQDATMTLSYVPGKTYKGKVTYIYPEVDKTTRTLKVRMEFPNADFQLKPDMYANVGIEVDFGRQVSIPQEAVLDSGTEQIVFVALGDGYFEPRKVQVGARVGDRFIVVSGLNPGEQVVSSGNFLIDSESRLKSALRGMGSPAHAGHGATGGEAGVGRGQPPSGIDHSSHQQKNGKTMQREDTAPPRTGVGHAGHSTGGSGVPPGMDTGRSSHDPKSHQAGGK